MSQADPPLNVAIVVGEHSGDQLGFKLMRALRIAAGDRPVRFMGVGGEAMDTEGLVSIFPLHDISVMGILPVIARLPTILARIRQTIGSIVESRPDVLVIIDSPDFTHRVARGVRKSLPGLPVVDYVSPSVWAWRPGRARTMRAYVDHVLALLPFEPAAHQRLGGPLCTYVGHPLIERLDVLRPSPVEADRRNSEPPILVVLPGSRRSEITRLMKPFGETLHRMVGGGHEFEAVIPAVSHLAAEIRMAARAWPVRVRVVEGESEKLATFRTARAALAASGTVTLELALSGVPMVVGYKFSMIEDQLKFLVKVPSIVLPNLVLGENAVPEFLQERCDAPTLAASLTPLLYDTPARRGQMQAFEKLDRLMLLPDGDTPSLRAARIVLETMTAKTER